MGKQDVWWLVRAAQTSAEAELRELGSMSFVEAIWMPLKSSSNAAPLLTALLLLVLICHLY